MGNIVAPCQKADTYALVLVLLPFLFTYVLEKYINEDIELSGEPLRNFCAASQAGLGMSGFIATVAKRLLAQQCTTQ